jgi:L-alanine-DL-glutamate epimerase-like enolase superfamily enzyme
MKLTVRKEHWPYTTPFRITGYEFTGADVAVVTLEESGLAGQGEADGVYYRGETPDSMIRQIEAVRPAVENGIDRESLRALTPPGGARNAIDCALWDLEAKCTGQPVWSLAGVARPVPLVTTFTVGAGAPEEMARAAAAYTGAKAIKVKLTPDDPARCILAVREAQPDAWIGVDANQGFTRASLEDALPALRDARVSLIEQPFAIGRDADLDGLKSPIPIAADESLQCLADLRHMIGRYDAVNIKLDKCGGLTEGLMIAREARRLGLKVMVGCMGGTSLAMAPAFVLAQLCDFVDLDAPVFLAKDRADPAQYRNGEIDCPESLWGGTSSTERTH